MATPYPRAYRPILKAASQRYHIPARVLAAQEFIESGYARDVIAGQRRSSTGAFGISQFMPGTAKGYGVRPGLSRSAVRSQVFGHAHYLHDLGYARSPRRAIASYAGGPGNPQYGYAAKVLGLAPDYRGVVRGVKAGRGGSSGGGGGSQVVGGSPASSSRSVQQSGGTALAELTAKALQRQQGPPTFTLPSAPAFAAHVTLPEGQATGPPQSGLVVPQQSGPSLSELLAAAQSDANTVDAKSSVTNAVAGTRVGGGGGGGAGGAGPHGARHLKGTSNFEGTTVAAWIKPWLVYARHHGWQGHVGSGFRSYADQVRIYNSGVRPAAKPGTSNHEGSAFPRGAVDVDRASAPQLARILRRARSPLVFAGAKDPVHFSHPHNGGY